MSSVNLPRYVLLHDQVRIGPRLISSDTGPPRMAIYGFSDKHLYDAFRKSSDQALVPYPLVAGYFRTQLAEAGDVLRWVVIDAAGPQAPRLQAATMASLLDALENKATSIAVTHTLTFDPQASAYDVVEVESVTTVDVGTADVVAAPSLHDASLTGERT